MLLQRELHTLTLKDFKHRWTCWKKGAINGFFFCVSGGDVLEGRGYSLTISVLKCSTFFGLSTHLLMCEEITLFSPLVKITSSNMTQGTECSENLCEFAIKNESF